MNNNLASGRTFYFAAMILLAGQQLFSQIDSTFYINGYFGLGAASPVGELKRGDGDFGKGNPGVNIKLGAEVVLKMKFGISFDYEYAILSSDNPALDAELRNKIISGTKTTIDLESERAGISISNVSVGFTRVFILSETMMFQPKLCVGFGSFGYDYTNSFLTYDKGTMSNAQFVSYMTWEDYGFISLKPELRMLFILSRSKHSAWGLSVGSSLFFLSPQMELTEAVGIQPRTTYKTLRGNVATLNTSLAVHLMIR